MADVGDRRGQLILIAAVALAVVFIGLALILNSAIYTNNLASRNENVGAREALGIKSAAWSSGAAAIEHTNRQAYTDSYSGFESSLSGDLAETTAGQQNLSARSGRSVEVEFESGSVVGGTRVAQEDKTTFGPQEPDATESASFNSTYPYWRVAPQIPAMRGFVIDVNTASLTQVPQGSAETYVLNFDGSASFAAGPPFAVAHDSDSDDDPEHAIAIYESDSDPDDIKITYGDYEAGTTGTCTIDDAPSTVRIRASEQFVVGSPECREVFSYVAEINSPYDMYYVQPDAIEGNYQFVVERSYSNFKSEVRTVVSDGKYAFPDEGDAQSSPYASAAVWRADVDVALQTEDVRYRSSAAVVPNAPEDTP